VVANPSIARPDGQLTMEGITTGETEVTARLGSQTAAAQLKVTPATPAPQQLPVGLRFIPDVLRLQLGVPGASVRIVNVLPDGTEEDVDHRAEIKISNPEVAEVKWTASGPIFVAKKQGGTTATASQGNLSVAGPLMIQVVDLDAVSTLQVEPQQLQIVQGEQGEFQRVQLVPGGGTPVSVSFDVESENEDIVRVEPGGKLFGVAPGEATVVVRPRDVDAKFADVTGRATVRVTPPISAMNGELVLTGPTQSAAGASVNLRVELQGPDGAQDVTQDDTQLVVPEASERALVELLPGCKVTAKSPGEVILQARHQGLISNSITLKIDPVAARFSRIELKLDRGLMPVGERRPYELWGHPEGGGPPQNLSDQVIAASPSADPDAPQLAVAGGEFATHSPTTILAVKPGMIKLQARLRDQKSEVVELEIIEDNSAVSLSIQPESPITIAVGERTPAIMVFATRNGDPKPRQVDIDLENLSPELLSPSDENPNQFVGAAIGEGKIRAKLGESEATITVRVVPNPIETVELRPDLLWEDDGKMFRVLIDVTGSGQSAPGYRVVTVGNPEGKWVEATPTRDGKFAAALSSPKMKFIPGAVYNLRIEARFGDGEATARHPEAFEIKGLEVRRTE